MDTRGERTIRVLLAKSDQDAHDRGLRYIAGVLRDAGMEVILMRYGICEEVARVARQENVDVVGMSFYGSGYRYDVPTVLTSLKEHNMPAKFIIGGTIPREDWPMLTEMGVEAIFVPGMKTEEIIQCIRPTIQCIV
jgi:methylmalonyl-CoA mutase C-terminal domain/subunit